jgi:uncharacterized protein YpmB
MSESSEIQRQNRKINILIAIGVTMLVVIVAAGAFLFWHSKEGGQGEKAEGQRIIKEVGKIYLLPNEEPVAAQIKDKNKLAKSQSFDGKAQTGDYVLIYSGAKIALLYRESIHKLVSVVPIANQAAGQASDQQ